MIYIALLLINLDILLLIANHLVLHRWLLLIQDELSLQGELILKLLEGRK